MDMNGKIVLIAGASGGIGVEVARKLLTRGARVALHYRSKTAPLEPLLQEFGADRVVLVQADVTIAEQVDRMVADVLAKFGRIDSFITTVGTALRIRPFLDTPMEAIEETIDIELRSVIHCVRAVLPGFVAQKAGRIVLVGSDSGKVGTTGESVSAACRGAIIAFSKSIAREYARYGVQSNVVCPGPTDTGLWDDLVRNDAFGDKIGNAMIRAIPMRRLGKPEEVAAAAAFLASDEASYITGQAISVSGGLTMS